MQESGLYQSVRGEFQRLPYAWAPRKFKSKGLLLYSE
jgi:hypothetical protein